MKGHEITAYDAQYVYLAQKMGLKLATFDEKLMRIPGLGFDFEKTSQIR